MLLLYYSDSMTKTCDGKVDISKSRLQERDNDSRYRLQKAE